MPLSPLANARKSETADLRSRSVSLRESSRELQRRSQDCRKSVARTLAAMRRATAVEPSPNPYLVRLMRAESDLEGAIAECRVALAEVRRELAWRATGSGPVVH
jgi:hypothetical protein